MAYKGLRYSRYNVIDAETKKYKYATPKSFGRITTESFSAEYEDVVLRADDTIAESEKCFKQGTLTVGVADSDEAQEAELKGSTVTSGEVTKNVDDESPYFGYGHVIPMKEHGSTIYKVEMFIRCQNSNITHDANTKGDSTEFITTSYENKVYPLDEAMNGYAVGDWCKVKRFDTLSAAQEYLDGLLTPPVAAGNG